MTARLQCEMGATCIHAATYVDNKGFIYCEKHGEARKRHCPCRRLRPAEIKRLEAGKTLLRY